MRVSQANTNEMLHQFRFLGWYCVRIRVDSGPSKSNPKVEWTLNPNGDGCISELYFRAYCDQKRCVMTRFNLPVLLYMFFFAGPSHAQTVTGNLDGHITDP